MLSYQIVAMLESCGDVGRGDGSLDCQLDETENLHGPDLSLGMSVKNCLD